MPQSLRNDPGKVDMAASGMTDLDLLPRFLSLHQIARQSGLHRSAVTLMMLRGQLKPTAMMDVGDGREQFLFAASAVETVTRLAAAQPGDTGDHALL